MMFFYRKMQDELLVLALESGSAKDFKGSCRCGTKDKGFCGIVVVFFPKEKVEQLYEDDSKQGLLLFLT